MEIRELKGNLSVKNEGQLSLFPVGTGGAFTKKLYQNNYLLIKGDEHIMIDCGTRTPEAMSRLGYPVMDIENFVITHSHADHIGGLEEVILMGRYVKKRRPNIIITLEYEKPLWNDSLKGGAAWNESKGGTCLGFSDYWNVIRPRRFRGLDRPAWEIDYRGFNLVLFRTMHYPDSALSWKDSAFSTGLIIDKRILFTGDTRFDPSMVTGICSAFPIEAVFHDVQFFPGGVHTPFENLKTLPESIRNMTYLMHYPDNWAEKQKEIEAAGFAGFVRQQNYYDFS